MNDEARELLRAAALRGDTQITGTFHSGAGDCGLGVLHLAMHETRAQALRCFDVSSEAAKVCLVSLYRRFGLLGEAGLLVHCNDRRGWDFLDLATKFPPPDDPEAGRVVLLR